MPTRIGIFGGTFDPPHLGHLALADQARTQLHLDRLLWMLTPDPPHKHGQPITLLEHRLAMVRLAIAETPGFELSTVEIDRPGPHYALDTVKIVAKQNPEAELVYLMGGDLLRDLPTWHRPADLVAALRSIGVMRRPGNDVDLAALEKLVPGLAAKVRFVDAPLLDIAARDIRARIRTEPSLRDLLPVGVFDYIIEHQLYR